MTSKLTAQITFDNLDLLEPRCKSFIIKGIVKHKKLFDTYSVNTDLRLCHFLSQSCHETAGFKTLREYGSNKYFRKYGRGRLARNLGNRNVRDGIKFKGRGMFQYTGRYNVTKLGRTLGINLLRHPEQLEKFPLALESALIYWNERNLSKYADRNDIRTITKKINGGYNGLRGRRKYFRKALAIWGGWPPTTWSESMLDFIGQGSPKVRKGSEGSNVLMLQRFLDSTGYACNVDGDFGEGTATVVRNWQKSCGLPITGKIDSEDITHMQIVIQQQARN